MCLMNPNISHKPSKPHSHDAKLTVPSKIIFPGGIRTTSVALPGSQIFRVALSATVVHAFRSAQSVLFCLLSMSVRRCPARHHEYEDSSYPRTIAERLLLARGSADTRKLASKPLQFGVFRLKVIYGIQPEVEAMKSASAGDAPSDLREKRRSSISF
jgi:hypothetical protein